MSDILLIHGSCHGAWCWHAVIAELAALGHTARAIDLPGRGGSATTLADQAQAILAALRGPTVLVAHSAGGYPMTAAAQTDPSQITALVYLCAYVPRVGQNLAQMRRAGPSQPLAPALRLLPDRSAFHFDPALCTDLFYHDCPDPQAAIARLCPEPVAPQETALPDTARANALPRHYIRCTQDRAIPPDYQATMASSFAPANRHDLPASHSPFLSMPRRLAALIAGLD